jgi:glutamyl-Q tRNA(Asp) synthetase
LHFGSLLAAVASYLQARVNHGTWLLRVEDIDPPREQPGAVKRIIDALQAYGFAWDGPVTYQSQFAEHHETLVQHLLDAGLAYPCSCSRRDLASARRGPLGAIYPGTCRNGCHDNDVAIRVRTDDEPIRFVDLLQGEQSQTSSSNGATVLSRTSWPSSSMTMTRESRKSCVASTCWTQLLATFICKGCLV